MTPEQREERLAELDDEIRREWIKYVIADWALIIVPFAVAIIALLLANKISESAAGPVAVAGGLLSGVLIAYWIFRRIRPLQREREQIVALHGS